MSFAQILYGGWEELLRIVIVGALAYIAIILLLRAAGKRALAKLSAYDFIVTIALGSMLATSILSPGMTIDRAILAFALLIGLQRLFALLSMRSTAFFQLTNNQPTLVVHRGQFVEANLKRMNLRHGDIEAAVRSKGHASVQDIGSVVLETDGTLSVIASVEGTLAPPLDRDH